MPASPWLAVKIMEFLQEIRIIRQKGRRKTKSGGDWSVPVSIFFRLVSLVSFLKLKIRAGLNSADASTVDMNTYWLNTCSVDAGTVDMNTYWLNTCSVDASTVDMNTYWLYTCSVDASTVDMNTYWLNTCSVDANTWYEHLLTEHLQCWRKYLIWSSIFLILFYHSPGVHCAVTL